ncbi:MAG: tripartite tricarboxylate transporter TctB family protein [Gammaproteobacteria bacterium]|nr:tripartite tricarboxylate transporter TctB family protein [Gammaproteobacteria bacterium]
MNTSDAKTPPHSVTSVFPALFILLFAIAMLLWSQVYSEESKRFPTVVSGCLVVLALIDFWSRSGLPGQKAVSTFWGAGFTRREMSHNPSLSDEGQMFKWILICVCSIAAFGILVAVPIFCSLYTWLRARRSIVTAVLVGTGVFLFEFGIFEMLLDYELYRGLLFTEDGFESW